MLNATTSRALTAAGCFCIALLSAIPARAETEPRMHIQWSVDFEREENVETLFNARGEGGITQLGKGYVRLQRNPRIKSAKSGAYSLIGKLLSDAPIFKDVQTNADFVFAYKLNQPIANLRVVIKTGLTATDEIQLDASDLVVADSWRYVRYKLSAFERIDKKPLPETIDGLQLKFFLTPADIVDGIVFDIQNILIVENMKEGVLERTVGQLINERDVQTAFAGPDGYQLSPEIVYRTARKRKDMPVEERRILVMGGAIAKDKNFLEPLTKTGALKGWTIDKDLCNKKTLDLTTAGAALRESLNAKKPEFIVVVFETDQYNNPEFRATLTNEYPALLDIAQSSGAIVILTTMPVQTSEGLSKFGYEIDLFIRDTAIKRNLPFISLMTILESNDEGVKLWTSGKKISADGYQAINNASEKLLLTLSYFVCGRDEKLPGLSTPKPQTQDPLSLGKELELD